MTCADTDKSEDHVQIRTQVVHVRALGLAAACRADINLLISAQTLEITIGHPAEGLARPDHVVDPGFQTGRAR